MDPAVRQHLLKKLNEEIEVVSHQLVTSDVRSFEVFKELRGIHRGLSMAVDIVNDLAKKLEKEDDE